MSKTEKKEKRKNSEKHAKKESKKLKQPTQVDEPSEQEVAEFLDLNEIKIVNLKGEALKTKILTSYKTAAFPKDLRRDLKVFKTPTPIQAVSIPVLMDKSDLVGIAKTGSGKTMAFGLPGILHLNNSIKKPQVLVLSPTRELAMQIQEQFNIFGKSSNISTVCIYGGVPKKPQQDLLRQGASTIIATPGRLIDLFESDSSLCDLSSISYLVLDEADRMLDAGFEDSIKKIIAKLPAKRQTVMFSATWPSSIQKMAMAYLNNPVKITVGSLDLSANNSIQQRVEVLDPNAKESRLLQLLQEYHDSHNRILVFALYKKEASRLEGFLKRNGYKCASIHGDLSQDVRSRSLESFKNGSTPVLIATDVAARGIDIPNVEYVINVTFPLTVEDYCHRIGRTGRAGKTGISHTFFTLHDKAHSGSLINVLKQASQPVPPELMKFGTTVKRKVDPNYGVFARDVDMTVKGSKITFDDSD